MSPNYHMYLVRSCAARVCHNTAIVVLLYALHRRLARYQRVLISYCIDICTLISKGANEKDYSSHELDFVLENLVHLSKTKKNMEKKNIRILQFSSLY